MRHFLYDFWMVCTGHYWPLNLSHRKGIVGAQSWSQRKTGPPVTEWNLCEVHTIRKSGKRSSDFPRCFTANLNRWTKICTKIHIRHRFFVCLFFFIVSDHLFWFFLYKNRTKPVHIKLKSFVLFLYKKNLSLLGIFLRKVAIGCQKLCTRYTKIVRNFLEWKCSSDFLIVCASLKGVVNPHVGLGDFL